MINSKRFESSQSQLDAILLSRIDSFFSDPSMHHQRRRMLIHPFNSNHRMEIVQENCLFFAMHIQTAGYLIEYINIWT